MVLIELMKSFFKGIPALRAFNKPMKPQVEVILAEKGLHQANEAIL